MADVANYSKLMSKDDSGTLAAVKNLSPERFYREFTRRKKSGGFRTIRSPRIFLKVVQWFLAEFVFSNSSHIS